jgi:hypothetical protein
VGVQCPQCGTLNPWRSVNLMDEKGYLFECKNPACWEYGEGMDREPYSFKVFRPEGDLISVTKEHGGSGTGSGWLKTVDV